MKSDRAIGNAFVGCGALLVAGFIVLFATVVKVWWP